MPSSYDLLRQLNLPKLPIHDVLDELKRQLTSRNEVVLQAPPGAGKTTLVPLMLMDQPWLGQKKILMLEPRRLAAKSSAYRMASLLNEPPGRTVGYRMRLDTKVGPSTKIESITEGILTRMLQQAPALEDVGLVIFDEFHERNLDSDLALALCLKGRSMFREDDNPLKLLIMSATLESHAIAEVLDDAAIVTSEGKQFPVEVVYGQASQPRERVVDRVVGTAIKSLQDNKSSSILIFLPGQGEIRRAADELAAAIERNHIQNVQLRPLFGSLSIEEQTRAIAALENPNDRKVVLATNIAETSLTIDGIDVVIDSGLAREPVFDPATGMTRLQTVKISKASSIQRAGRAGRLRPGVCYRMWSSGQQEQLAQHSKPEIKIADLASLALQLLQWGVSDPAELKWLDRPPTGPWQQALDLLFSLGATKGKGNHLVLTTHGQMMSSLPVHPRLSHLLIRSTELKNQQVGVFLASILSDRDPFDDKPDINERLDILTGEAPCPSRFRGWIKRTERLAQQFDQSLSKHKIVPKDQKLTNTQAPGFLLACAYPDRIARRRHSGGYQLANGRSANLMGNTSLGRSNWLAVAEVTGSTRSQGDIIRSAAALDPELFDTHLKDLVTDHTIADWDKKTNRFVAEQRSMIGALILKRKKLDCVPAEAKQAALIAYIEQQGVGLLPWTSDLRQWQAKVILIKQNLPDNQWPDVTDSNLTATLENWLGPYLQTISLLSDFKNLDLKTILQSVLSWEQQQQIEELTPSRLNVPSGSSISIDYTQSPPVLAVKLQEMFGCVKTPAVIRGTVPLLIHLLSPAGRPLQVTQDLAGFWKTSYHDVKKDMKGRYPKHPWPDDPLVAVPTRKTKARQV
jgi:ATP-dependent helicase HrpB